MGQAIGIILGCELGTNFNIYRCCHFIRYFLGPCTLFSLYDNLVSMVTLVFRSYFKLYGFGGTIFQPYNEIYAI